MIFTDQQRFDALGAAGNPLVKTPNLDRLAKEGCMYTNCMTPSPLCQPARAVVTSGIAASRLGCLENNDPKCIDRENALPALLHKAGYYAMAVGKMHFSNKPYEEDYGMDRMILSEETRGVRFTKDPEDVVFDDYDRFLMGNHFWGWDKPTEIGYNEIKPLLNPLPSQYHVTRWCGDESIGFIESRKDNPQPFFLWASFVKPHVPYDCPRHLEGLYDPETMPEPWTSSEDGTTGNPLLSDYRKANEFDLYSRHARDLSLSYYFANITFVDEQIGRILEALDRSGKADNTLILFSSDHGDLMGDHGLFYKCFGFEGSMHVPLIMKWPSHIAKGSVRNDVVSLFDIYPTLLSVAGIPIPSDDMPGRNILQCTHQEDFAFSEVLYPPKYLCHVRTKEWKYLFYQNGGTEALYHILDDPKELKDLSKDPGYQDRLEYLRGQAENWIRRYGNREGILDDAGHFITHPFVPEKPSVSPFSRMPWDYRVPPCLVERPKLKKTFWKGLSEDWSDHIRKDEKE